MDTDLVILRLLHIVASAYWVGSALFIAFILEPILRNLGPAVQGPVMQALGKVLTPVQIVAALVTIIFGGGLVSQTPGHEWAELFDTAWGWMIAIGFITSGVAFVIGLVNVSTVRVLMRLGAQAAAGDGPPDPGLLAQIQSRSAQLRLFGRSIAVLVVVATATMAAARFA